MGKVDRLKGFSRLRKNSLFTLRQAQGERDNDDNQGVSPVRGEPVEPQTEFFRILLGVKELRGRG